MTSPDLATPVGRWVAEQPSTAAVFEQFSIDYCCGGAQPLGEACAARNLDPSEILAQLAAASAPKSEPLARWNEAPLAELCDHIETTHHAYLKRELPRLEGLIAKVVAAHGLKHPELLELRDAFQALQAELGPHMFKEERVLFPAIRALERSDLALSFPFGSMTNPIAVTEEEHDHAADALARIRRAAHNFQPPADACTTFRVLLDALHTLERDMHQHVHKENHILFPRAIALEGSRGEVELHSLGR